MAELVILMTSLTLVAVVLDVYVVGPLLDRL